MNNFYTFIVNLIQALTPIFMIGCSAFLIFKQVDGWGWFLFITLIVLDAWNFTPDAYTTPPEETPRSPFPPAPPKPKC